MYKKINTFFLGSVLIIAVTHFFFEKQYQRPELDSRLYDFLYLQRQIDLYNPLSESHLQGTHNSYNSDAYHHLFNYHDRQQRLSIADQLAAGARFIELDAHWTISFNQWPRSWRWEKDLLLCHGSSKFDFFPFHWGCSPFDIPLERVLVEVSEWIQRPENSGEVLIFYIEDHSDGQHEYLHHLLVKHRLAERMFESDGCHKIPDNLSKHDVLQQGKQIIFWKDKNCSDFAPLANLAFADLGNLQRYAEDRTFIGTYSKRLIEGAYPRIEAQDVHAGFLKGANIINFDEFVFNDERLYQFLWSWDLQVEMDPEHKCVQQQANSRWIGAQCQSEGGSEVAAACFNLKEKRWLLTQPLEHVSKAQAACKKLGEFVFSAPTNFIENTDLHAQLLEQQSEQEAQKIWLNLHKQGNTIIPGDPRRLSDSSLMSSGITDDF